MNKKYITLAGRDFKCLEQCIKDINSDKSQSPEKKEVKYKCKRDEDVLCVMNKLFEDIEGNKESFVAFNYDKWSEWKNKGGIDLDDSRNSMPNPYMRAIYYTLWGKKISLGEPEIIKSEKDIFIYENGWERFSKSYLFAEEKLLLGGDTMNTIASYRSEIKKFKNLGKENSDKVDELCRVVHQLGNFVLVPAYFNGFRGLDEDINDCMDSSLCYLKKYNFELEERIQLKLSKEEKKAFVKGHFAGWESKNFNKYINIFFLWDYVYANEDKYYVRNLKCDSKGEDGIISKDDNELKYKVTSENINIYIENAKVAILRRSKFMAAMLMLAVEFKEESYKEEWKDWHVSDIYKEIVENIFLTDKVYNDFNSVIKKVKDIIQDKQYEEVIEILDTICTKQFTQEATNGGKG